MSTTTLERESAVTRTPVTEVIISADSHVNEPHDLWTRRLPSSLQSDEVTFPAVRDGNLKGGTDGRQRLQEMAQDGVSAEVLYPSRAASLYALKDPAQQETSFRIYNEWIREYIGDNTDRLVGIPSISVYNIDNAVKELRRSHAEGLTGGAQIWQAPPKELPFSSPHYEPLWNAAEDLGVPINLHVNSGPAHNLLSRNKTLVETYRNKVNLRTLDGADAIFDLIFSGVLQRHPRLKFVLAEHQIGWVPFYLEQWDWFAKGQGTKLVATAALPLEREPSYYYYRQIYSTFFNDYAGGRTLGWWEQGHDNSLWISDYPHANTSWPHSRRMIDRLIGHLGPAVRAKLLHDNAAKLYGIKNLAPLNL